MWFCAGFCVLPLGRKRFLLVPGFRVQGLGVGFRGLGLGLRVGGLVGRAHIGTNGEEGKGKP